jgi:hypothetical protein
MQCHRSSRLDRPHIALQLRPEILDGIERVEPVIRRFKIFRIFAGRTRNRRRRFGLRLNLIAGLLNYELAHIS